MGRCRARLRLLPVTLLSTGLAVAAACTSSGPLDQEVMPTSSTGSTPATGSTSVPSPASSSTVDTSQANPSGWDALPVCGDRLVGFEVDGELSRTGWVASAQIDRASAGLPSDIASVLELDASLSAEHLVANGFRTEAEQVAIQESIPYYEEPFFQAELGALRWDHPDVSAGLVPAGAGRFVATMTAAGRATVLPMVERAWQGAAEADVPFDVEAVEVQHSMDDLEAIRTELATRVPDWWLRIDTWFDAVAVDLGFAEPSDEERWPFDDVVDGVCRLVGNPTGDFGPQPASGEGWRLLAITDSSGAEPVPLALTMDELVDLWADLDVPDDVPAVHFSSEIVVVFFELRGFPPFCDRVIFDGVEFDEDRVSGRPRNVDPIGLRGCLAIGLPRSFVVALDRTNLPTGPFVIRRDAQPWSSDGEREQVTVDLTDPAG